MRKAEDDTSALAARNLRERILSDPSPGSGYHFVMPEGIASPFDPNGAIYWKGRYHLFYIFQDKRSGKKLDHWGHMSSTDLFHWRHHPTRWCAPQAARVLSETGDIVRWPREIFNAPPWLTFDERWV